MQCVTKKLSQEFLTYWNLKKKTHQCDNIFQSNSLNIGRNIVVKVHPFTRSSRKYSGYPLKNYGVLLIITNVGENYLMSNSSFFDLYFDENGSKIIHATYSGHESIDRKIDGKEMLKIMKCVHGIKIKDVNELYRKMKRLNVEIV